MLQTLKTEGLAHPTQTTKWTPGEIYRTLTISFKKSYKIPEYAFDAFDTNRIGYITKDDLITNLNKL